MQRKRLFIVVALVVVVISIFVLHTFGVTGTGMRREFQTIAADKWRGLSTPQYYVIQDYQELAHIWNITHPLDEPLPDVDFSETTIIAVFMGECISTGYVIWVNEIIDTGLTIVVKVWRVSPGKGCVIGYALTYPYEIIKTDKISKYVVFNTFTTTGEDCG